MLSRETNPSLSNHPTNKLLEVGSPEEITPIQNFPMDAPGIHSQKEPKVTPANIKTLQRTIGNQAVMRLLHR